MKADPNGLFSEQFRWAKSWESPAQARQSHRPYRCQHCVHYRAPGTIRLLGHFCDHLEVGTLANAWCKDLTLSSAE